MMDRPTYARRQALKLLGGAALAAVPAARRAAPAAAGRTWCKADPLFQIGDCVYDVALAADIAMLTAATGPVAITLTVPRGVPVELVYSDLGFGHGYRVAVVESRKYKQTNNSLSLAVTVVAPASDGSIPVEVSLTSLDAKTFIAQQTVSGFANQELTWSGKIEAVTLIDLFSGK